jgi:hypothetical protein
MRRFSAGLVGLCMWGVACADSGGLPGANGSALTEPDGGGDAGSVDSSDATTDAGANGHDTRAKARSYAHNPIPCMSDSDCCVAIDSCTNEALVIGVADQEVVDALLTIAYAWSVQQISLDRTDMCTLCVPPDVQVACSASGWCVGEEAHIHTVGRPHCGREYADAAATASPLSVTPAPPAKHALTVIGCGGDVRDY